MLEEVPSETERHERQTDDGSGSVAPEPLRYLPALDGMRAVAVAWVVAYHYSNQKAPFAGGFLGVDLFFVLSGFLITRLLIDERRAHGAVSLGGFYKRRVARLLPGFLFFGLVLVVLVHVGVTLYGNPATVDRGFFASATYSANWFAAAHRDQWLGPFTPMWSLSVEEQFYLLWPITLLLLLRKWSPERTGRIVLGAVVFVFAQVALRSLLFPTDRFIIWGTDAEPMGALLLGCATGLVLFNGRDVKPTIERFVRQAWPLATICLLIFFTQYDEGSGTLFYERGVGALLCCCMVVLLGAALLDTPARRALSWRPLVYVGRRSYEIYLWHVVVAFAIAWTLHRLGWYPNLLILTLVIAAATLLVSEVAYRFVEQPLRRTINGRRAPASNGSRTRP
jgi:peptidoglycan/LPS O-acetylase OafA/YrhL